MLQVVMVEISLSHWCLSFNCHISLPKFILCAINAVYPKKCGLNSLRFVLRDEHYGRKHTDAGVRNSSTNYVFVFCMLPEAHKFESYVEYT